MNVQFTGDVRDVKVPEKEFPVGVTSFDVRSRADQSATRRRGSLDMCPTWSRQQ